MVASNESRESMTTKGLNNMLLLESFAVMPLQNNNPNADAVQKPVKFSGLIEKDIFLSVHLTLSLKIIFIVKIFGQLME